MIAGLNRHLMFAIAGIALLSGCSGGVRETLGINKKAPDEFKVVSRPPLSVPPEFSLQPPSSGTGSDEFGSATKQAEGLVFGEDGTVSASPTTTVSLKPGTAETAVAPVTSSNLGSNAESQFLKNAGVDTADTTVRKAIYDETRRKRNDDESTLKMLTTLPEKGEPVVDAAGEAERIKENQEQGKPVTEGETPETKSRDTGILGRIFGY